MTFDRDEQFLHEKLSADLHPAPVDLWPAVAENLPAKPHRRHLWLCLAAPLLIAAGVAANIRAERLTLEQLAALAGALGESLPLASRGKTV